jgi:hypothetical protein
MSRPGRARTVAVAAAASGWLLIVLLWGLSELYFGACGWFRQAAFLSVRLERGAVSVFWMETGRRDRPSAFVWSVQPATYSDAGRVWIPRVSHPSTTNASWDVRIPLWVLLLLALALRTWCWKRQRPAPNAMCRRCGYELLGLAGPQVCPECGVPLSPPSP